MERRSLLRALPVLSAPALAGCSLLALTGPGPTFEELTVDLTLNDEFAGDFPDSRGPTVSCAAFGPVADTYSVRVEGLVSGPGGVGSGTYELTVAFGGMSVGRSLRIGGGTTRIELLFTHVEDDESFQPGEEATVTVSLTHEHGPGTEVTLTTTVTEQDQQCVDTG